MAFASSLLKPIHSPQEAPPDTYLLYNLDGGIFYVSTPDFPHFTLEWIGLQNPPPLTLDLASACSHAVVLDLDYHGPGGTFNDIFQIIETVLKMTFLPGLSHFTYIVALRSRHFGIHIHLPEFRIGHDDYIVLCEVLQYKFRQALLGDSSYTLDILLNAMLPGASKPKTSAYAPLMLVYIDEHHTHTFHIPKYSAQLNEMRRAFSKRKNNESSLYRSLLKLNSFRLFLGELKQLMMPVICARSDAPTHTLFYATSIAKQSNHCADWNDVATFTYKKTKEPGYISKCKKLAFDNPHWLRVYHHLKLNASHMTAFETSNHAMKVWHRRFSRPLDTGPVPPFFQEVHELLHYEHALLARNPNPLKTLLQYREGYYFLPVFYALCNHYQKHPTWVAEQLTPLLDGTFHPLLDRLRALPPIQYALADMTLNTLHFCANNLCEQQPQTHRDKLKAIVENHRRALLSVTTHDQMVELIRSLQERHLPIRVLKLKNALKKPSRFIWNPLKEYWQEISAASEISDHLQNLWSTIKQYYNEHRQAGEWGGPDEELVHKFGVATVVSAILSDTAMERKDIQMDTHKWLLRLQEGVLDLLTGHIGGVVPEFFLSDRKIDLGLSRPRMTALCEDAAMIRLYETLVDKAFFLKYLQALFLDRRDTLWETLFELVSAPPEEEARSMLHFYVNLCKCTSFEYDLLVYLLDVLASVLIGTNYERKFFVWKGLTRNGKSKLFELMGRVLGGYYHSIQSDNLAPGHATNTATPELASTLFACRMVTSEELEKRLDENRVKQITGNSFVAFRNMYEQNAGGIPTAKLFATTNNYPECKASEAFKDRVVAIPFEAEFVDQAPPQTSVQVEKNTFKKDAYVVEQSYQGCFFMLYYHLKRRITLDDGLLHYREAPPCVVEFTHDYLIHADIYVQFKLFMDVQLKAGAQTTMNEVKSAVRQYLKMTKNTAFHETDLFMSFEKEFGELRQTDLRIPTEAFSYVSEEPTQKAARRDPESSLVFYEGVVIRNLRRQTGED